MIELVVGNLMGLMGHLVILVPLLKTHIVLLVVRCVRSKVVHSVPAVHVLVCKHVLFEGILIETGRLESVNCGDSVRALNSAEHIFTLSKEGIDRGVGIVVRLHHHTSILVLNLVMVRLG